MSTVVFFARWWPDRTRRWPLVEERMFRAALVVI